MNHVTYPNRECVVAGNVHCVACDEIKRAANGFVDQGMVEGHCRPASELDTNYRAAAGRGLVESSCPAVRASSKIATTL